MTEQSAHPNHGPLTRFMIDDHARLDTLLRHATSTPGRIDQSAYDAFRAGLLRHIALEEKFLLPRVHSQLDSEALAIADRLRREHGALATLLMPTPTPAIVATLRRILEAHNKLEEGPTGFYATCEELLQEEAHNLLPQMKAAAEPAVRAHSDTPTVRQTLNRVLDRAGYHLAE